MSKSIPWKYHNLDFINEKTRFKAKITYWAKDYSIEVYEPFQKVIPGPHMMYMIPAMYGINESVPSGVRVIDLIKECKKKILFEYNKN